MADQNTIKEKFLRNREAVQKRPSLAQSRTVTKVSLRDGTTCEVHHKDWKLTVDIGKSEGGNDAGPGPGILERGALGSCLAIGYAQQAALMDIPLDSLEVDVMSDFDARGMLGLKEGNPGFDALKYTVRIGSPASETRIREMIYRADKRSPVLDDFSRAIPVKRALKINTTE